MKRKKQRMVAAILAVIMALVLVVPIFLQTVSADELVTSESSQENELLSSSSDETDVETVTDDQTETDESVNSASSKSGSEGRVYIENIDVTDMTEAQITAAVADKMEELSAYKINLWAGPNSAEVTAGSLGLTYTNTEIAKEAYSIGRKGNILKKFRSQNHLQKDGDIILDLDLQVTDADIRTSINNVLGGLNSDPVKNGLKMKKDGTFAVTDKKDGATVNMKNSVSIVSAYMDEQWHGGEGAVTLDATLEEAEDTSAQLATVKNIIGTGTTTYTEGDTGRNTNMKLAVALLDGAVIYPGETFSYYDTVGETTPERGFAMAPSYDATSVTESYGGGVCQTSTTLYLAVLAAELDVVERHQHSMLVGYAEPSLDAAVAWGLMDLKFTNTSNNPIYIQGTIGDGQLTFNIYGMEARPSNRTLSFQSRVTETLEYDTKYQLDSSLAFGQVQTSGGTYGYRAEAVKNIYIGGAYDSEEIVNASVYNAVPLTYKVGTKGASDSTILSLSAAVQSKDINEVYQAIWSGSYA